VRISRSPSQRINTAPGGFRIYLRHEVIANNFVLAWAEKHNALAEADSHTIWDNERLPSRRLSRKNHISRLWPKSSDTLKVLSFGDTRSEMLVKASILNMHCASDQDSCFAKIGCRVRAVHDFRTAFLDHSNAPIVRNSAESGLLKLLGVGDGIADLAIFVEAASEKVVE